MGSNEQRLIDANALDTVPWEDQFDAIKAPYCPNCGAKMKNVRNSRSGNAHKN